MAGDQETTVERSADKKKTRNVLNMTQMPRPRDHLYLHTAILQKKKKKKKKKVEKGP